MNSQMTMYSCPQTDGISSARQLVDGTGVTYFRISDSTSLVQSVAFRMGPISIPGEIPDDDDATEELLLDPISLGAVVRGLSEIEAGQTVGWREIRRGR